ncbi:helix-turn-helix domain-containing protein [Modicisalibacter sp. 'Wilcox']|uniref:helix-turn-helix domain-containing protein n=1 Tax=Modicisalibacter sp. 'Wilcox' TaxID=2679914 RepID=UPI0013CF6186|nr:helix-turn-helix domain-containing protein [Modicisalibacter sp. 'Wilcox']
MTTKHLSPEIISERRLQAVRLRLDGMTVAETARRTGLSPPTVSAAWKAFREGGWEAVPVRPRGRPTGQGATLGDAQHRHLEQRLGEWPAGNQPGWSARTLAQSLSAGATGDTSPGVASPGDVSPRAVEHWLAQQDLKPAPLALAGFERRRSAAGRWYRQQVLPAVGHRNGHVWQAGARVSAGTQHHPRRYQLFVHGKRDTLYTRCFTAPPRADDYLQLFTRLLGEGCNALLFRGADLTASPEIQAWLRKHPDFLLIFAPPDVLPVASADKRRGASSHSRPMERQ